MLELDKYLGLLTLTTFSILLSPTVSIPVNAQPNNLQIANSGDFYDRAKTELGTDMYAVYRIVEKIARANKLDESTWRVIISPEYELNAFASDINLVAVYNGLLDRVAGDYDALACVIGHEMAHHTKRHIALSPAQEAKTREQYRQEAEAQVKQEIEDAQSDIETQQTGSDALSIFGGVVGNTVGGDVGMVIGGSSTFGALYLQANAEERERLAKQRIEEIVAEKEAKLNETLAEQSRQQEFEADEEGYIFMAKAGFDPQGCLRMMDILGRTEGAEFDSTHPAVPKRIENLKELIKKYPAQSLANEGKVNLNASSKPLTYEKSKDGVSLRINSRFGRSNTDGVDRVLDR